MSFYPSVQVAANDNGIPYDVVYDNSGPLNQVLYEGAAYPGTSNASGQAKWRIKKFLYDANNQIYGWRWADGSTAFDKDWTLRTGYTYASL